jgi:hypothetical protein
VSNAEGSFGECDDQKTGRVWAAGLEIMASNAQFESCGVTYRDKGVKPSMMKPGEIRTFRKGAGSAVVPAVGIWAKRASKKPGGPIHIHITATPKFHITVTNKADSERYHRTLFRDFRNVLLENNCWPSGDEGAETQTRAT